MRKTSDAVVKPVPLTVTVVDALSEAQRLGVTVVIASGSAMLLKLAINSGAVAPTVVVSTGATPLTLPRQPVNTAPAAGIAVAVIDEPTRSHSLASESVSVPAQLGTI